MAAKCLEVVLHRLKHQGPHRVLKHLAWLVARCPSPAMQEKLSYLQKREAHMQYPPYQQAGWPIGSGSVESANKVVVEARPKGAGMRLPSAERQPHARAPQCGLQSLVARDLGDVSGSSTSASHESATSRQKASTGGASSFGEYGCIGCLIHLFTLPPHRRLEPSKSNRPVVLALAIPGANHFSGVLLPPLCVRERRVQKNETHPYQSKDQDGLMRRYVKRW